MTSDKVVGVTTDREGNLIVVTENGAVFEMGYLSGDWVEHDPVPGSVRERAKQRKEDK